MTQRNAATAERPEQLSMLAASGVPLQFRLDGRTRRLGLDQLALLRRQMAERAAVNAGVGVDQPVSAAPLASRAA